MQAHFDHEKLDVYRNAIGFVAWVAEGNGKYTLADRCRFFDIARGSELECAACLDARWFNP